MLVLTDFCDVRMCVCVYACVRTCVCVCDGYICVYIFFKLFIVSYPGFHYSVGNVNAYIYCSQQFVTLLIVSCVTGYRCT